MCATAISTASIIYHWQRSTLSVPLPTRLLDVGPVRGPQSLSLFESQGSFGQYVTPSHRWGEARRYDQDGESFFGKIQTQHSLGLLSEIVSRCNRYYAEVEAAVSLDNSLCIIQDNISANQKNVTPTPSSRRFQHLVDFGRISTRRTRPSFLCLFPPVPQSYPYIVKRPHNVPCFLLSTPSCKEHVHVVREL